MRYAKYKPTGIAWLPEVPEGWECVRLGVLGSLSNGLSKGGESFGTGFPFVAYGDVYRNSALPMRVKGLVQSTPAEQKACSVLRGDVFFTRTSESIEEIGFSSVCLSDLDKATFAGFLIRFRPRGNEAMPEFSQFYFRNFRLRVYFQLRISGLITRASLSQSVLRDLPVLLPPLPTQRAIVAYLDEKCGKVDRLVAAKEKEAALLKELKQSMIAEAVTRGVRPKRRLIPSGIPWLPEVPEGWEVKRAKYLFQKEQRPVRAGDEIVTCFRDGEVTLRKNRRISGFTEATDYSHYQHICAGDLVIHQMDAFAGSCGVSDSDGMGTPVLSVCTPKNDRLDVRYFAAVVRLMGLNGFIQSLYRGIRERSSDFRFETFAKQVLPVPSLAEQREIVAHIEARAAKIDAAVKGLEREVAALKEYKQRLIADVVTGQRKVA